jgi:diguanylate cyclase (GGDEF)-like protein
MMSLVWGFIVPLALACGFWIADYIEGPRIVIAGGIIAIPGMSAIFSRPKQTALLGTLVLLGTALFMTTTDDVGTPTAILRLASLAIGTSLAVVYSAVRTRKDDERDRLIQEVFRLGQTSELAFVDQLTGLNNRRGVLEALKTSSDWPRTVALFDVDKLKNINDNFGHQVGDEFISAIAGRLRGSISSGDILGRWGGDEFIVIFPLTPAQAKTVVERVIGQIGSALFVTGDSRIEPRVSCGFAEWKATQTLEHSISLADTALYEAKSRGGQCAHMDLTLLEA